MNHTFEELLEGTRQAQGTARIMADRHLQKAHQAAIAQAVEEARAGFRKLMEDHGLKRAMEILEADNET